MAWIANLHPQTLMLVQDGFACALPQRQGHHVVLRRIGLLGRVTYQVVQLLVAAHRRPRTVVEYVLQTVLEPKSESAVVRGCVGPGFLGNPRWLTSDQRKQRHTIERICGRLADGVEDRGENIDQTDLFSDSGPTLPPLWKPDDERNHDVVLVEIVVTRAVLLSKSLTVIRSHDNDRILHQLRGLEVVKKSTQLRIGESNPSVVTVNRKLEFTLFERPHILPGLSDSDGV